MERGSAEYLAKIEEIIDKFQRALLVIGSAGDMYALEVLKEVEDEWERLEQIRIRSNERAVGEGEQLEFDFDGPEYGDGCAAEGFVDPDSCERMGFPCGDACIRKEPMLEAGGLSDLSVGETD